MGLLAFAIAAYLLPRLVGFVSHTMGPKSQMAVFFSCLFLTAAAICAMPLVKWAAWRCPPRCGNEVRRAAKTFRLALFACPRVLKALRVPTHVVQRARCPVGLPRLTPTPEKSDFRKLAWG